jgi:hypothetical protein
LARSEQESDQMRVRLQSLAVTKLELFFHDIPLGPATGFFYKYGQGIALVSNWHVFSGVNPLTGNLRNPDRLSPNRVKFTLKLFDPNTGIVSARGEQVLLVENEQSLWWQHKGYIDPNGLLKIVDIGVLVLDKRLSDFEAIKDKIVSLPAFALVGGGPTAQDMRVEPGYPRVAAEVFILGYPQGLSMQGVMPVWKRGSIASEPLFNVMDQAPAFLVDAATRGGMSGSPVLYFGNEITDAFGHPVDVGGLQGEPWLVGVYAGREGVTQEEMDMTLGRVWHRSLLDEIFYGQIPGNASKPAA